MKKAVVLSLALFLFTPSLVFSNTLTLKLGLFIPRFQYDVPEDNLWWIEFDQMDFKKSDYYSTNFGFAFDYFVTRQLSLVLSIDSYSKNKLGKYKGYVGYYAETLGTTDNFAFPDIYEGDYIPSHSFNVSITPIQLSLKLLPLGRGGKLIPYVGGGVGFYIWNVRLFGDLIDFSDEWIYSDPDTGEDVPIYPINPGKDYTDTRQETKVSMGYHAFGGIMYPIANRTTIELEFKYNLVKGKFQEKDPYQGFHGFERFDLGGYQISIGINYWF
jgi:opacity protein-like surface antigen